MADHNDPNAFSPHDEPSEVRVIIQADQRATVRFLGFPYGDFSTTLELNKSVPIQAPDGQTIQAWGESWALKAAHKVGKQIARQVLTEHR